MDEGKRNHIPAFGNWDYNEDLPITQYFESARQAGLLRYSSSGEQDLYTPGDLYIAGDLYGDDLKKSSRTVVIRPKTKGREKRYPHVKEQKKQGRVCDFTEPPRKHPQPHHHPKAVDEDLYKIPPELLRTNTKRVEENGFLFKMPNALLHCLSLQKKLH
ncbi:hypothetical protein HHK36_013142 [Tetracentron sinense]|uniref:RPM1-interacting protein 4-like n=1 Tax=Tetracentron sinense TaxID=13715 RepID=A0A834ZGI9_TETSI|nr:hypothetical protein HHK36_013139 [Tetracentron sinense]KAF8402190.1 hypothetical protein HHK36_013142 [Tetracentron sinense]